jgi:hypothetical protein
VKAVQQAHIARRQALELLERAKRAVEIAIEENEAAGLRYLNTIDAGKSQVALPIVFPG